MIRRKRASGGGHAEGVRRGRRKRRRIGVFVLERMSCVGDGDERARVEKVRALREGRREREWGVGQERESQDLRSRVRSTVVTNVLLGLRRAGGI